MEGRPLHVQSSPRGCGRGKEGRRGEIRGEERTEEGRGGEKRGGTRKGGGGGRGNDKEESITSTEGKRCKKNWERKVKDGEEIKMRRMDGWGG